MPLSVFWHAGAVYNLPIMKKPTTLREKKKGKTRAALLEAANQLFRTKGFEATTIDDLCEAIDISRRTFFRYFPNKEALVFPNRDERLANFQNFLKHAPPEESPFDILRRATRAFGAEYTANRQQLIDQQNLIQSSPTLISREQEIDRDWEQAMVTIFAERSLGAPGAELRARVLAGATIGVVRATMRHWFACKGEADLAELGIEALECLERGFPLDEAKPTADNPE
jgi:AcrR family transcriptional regulator